LSAAARIVPRLLMITPPRAIWGAPLRGALEAAVDGGVDALLVRLPTSTAAEVFELARHARPLLAAAGARLLIHDRLDVALAVRADGVHLARRSLPLAVARACLPSGILGYSAHSDDEREAARDGGADYVTLSPVFATTSKPDVRPLGPAAAMASTRGSALPTLWLGGICAANIESVARDSGVGPHGLAAIDAFADAGTAGDEARRMSAWLGAR
jgi:thiamine-phosphate pyrophosphorylase